jgi:hypothetical protein
MNWQTILVHAFEETLFQYLFLFIFIQKLIKIYNIKVIWDEEMQMLIIYLDDKIDII